LKPVSLNIHCAYFSGMICWPIWSWQWCHERHYCLLANHIIFLLFYFFKWHIMNFWIM